MPISLQDIKECCYSSRTYERGLRLFAQKNIQKIAVRSSDIYQNELNITAVAYGSYGNTYDVRLSLYKDTSQIQDYECTCQAFETYDGMCKHCVALALAYRERQVQAAGTGGANPADAISDLVSVPKRQKTDAALKRVIIESSLRQNARYFQPEHDGKIELEPCLHQRYPYWCVEFKIGAEHKYVLKDITQFVADVASGATVEYGKKLQFIHEKHVFMASSRKILYFLEECIAQEQSVLTQENSVPHWGVGLYMRKLTKRELLLTPERMVRFLELLSGKSCRFFNAAGESRVLEIVPENPECLVTLDGDPKQGFWLELPAAESFAAMGKLFVYMENRIFQCDAEFASSMGTIMSLCRPHIRASYDVNPQDMPTFCSSLLPALEQYAQVEKCSHIAAYMPKQCVVKIYIDVQESQEGSFVVCELTAWYGEDKYNIMESLSAEEMFRDVAKESAAAHTAAAYFNLITPARLMAVSMEDNDRLYRLASTGLEQLQGCGELYISEALKPLRVIRPPKVSVRVSINAGLLDIDIGSKRLPMEELSRLLDSYRKKKKYYRLENGSFIQLEDTGLSAVAELTEGLNLKEKDVASGHISVPRYRSFYVDQSLKGTGGELDVTRESSYKAVLRCMADIENSDYEAPPSLSEILRPYQKFGFRWLMTLNHLGFSGILADDMGLGKTLQMIAFLLAQKEEGGAAKKSLIVCPASLVYNWENEIHRFAPSLSVRTIIGTVKQREALLGCEQPADIYLTSYDLLKRDAALYAEMEFNFHILDEAQNIKNHTTQAAKAVKEIRSSVRFALTGTPIENTLGELWSIFDFLMPGILGPYKKFRENYETPIAQGEETSAALRLQRMVKPFILRRLKTDVLKELPDKIEEVIYSRMEKEQQAIYYANVQQVLDSLTHKTAEEVRTGKLQILAELTRLRQLCCDPSLVYSDYKGGSAKADTCVELISNAVDAGNKVLVFSQFTSMLAILKKKLEAKGIDYHLLTGSTSKEKRNELVQSFHKDSVPVFLISLKAGGTGLNLTAASIVIHYDPWWNAAAQNQATDRAHRIGQTQVVTVYKLLVKDTIEEKIAKLQEKKAQLSGQIISEGGVTQDLVTKEDFLEILGGGTERPERSIDRE